MSFKVGDRVRFGKAEGVVFKIDYSCSHSVIVRFSTSLEVFLFFQDGSYINGEPEWFPKLELIQGETVALKNDCFKTDVGNE